jgi:putative transposase
MRSVVYAFLSMVGMLFRSRFSLQAEVIALRHQLTVYHRLVRRPQIRPADRILWSWLSRHWARCGDALVFVQPATVIAWQRKRFRDHWRRISQCGKPGRSAISQEIRELIRRMSSANPLWGTPRIVGELGKLGIEVAKSTVDKFRVRPRKPPAPTWKTFLRNYVHDLVSIDFFIVPTIQFKLLFVLVVLAHARRKVIHCNVTENPTAQWPAQQIIEAFPWDSAPKHLLRDRDAIYGNAFQQRVQSMGIEQVLSAPRSPWQTPFVERLIGTLPRLPRSCDRPERTASQADPCPVSRLLPSVENSPFVAHGCSQSAGRTSARPGQGSRISRTRRPAQPLRTTRGVN